RYPYLCFFFNDPATTEIYTLSLHDALPIYRLAEGAVVGDALVEVEVGVDDFLDDMLDLLIESEPDVFPRVDPRRRVERGIVVQRSEEHTSELQSLTNLVCRLLLEKKKKVNS